MNTVLSLKEVEIYVQQITKQFQHHINNNVQNSDHITNELKGYKTFSYNRYTSLVKT